MTHIKIVSDVSCPWCVIGYKALHAAISELGIENQVVIEWGPFELNTEMPAEGQDRSEHIQQKYGISAQQALANRQGIVDRGLAEGYQFNFADAGRVYNTFDAHRLLHWAAIQNVQNENTGANKQTELKLALFDLYFKHEGNPSDHQQLLRCVEQVGLDSAAAAEVLQGTAFAQEVRAEQALNTQQGISAVPAFIFENKYLVSGGQPKEAFASRKRLLFQFLKS